jgi:hypothetical protein
MSSESSVDERPSRRRARSRAAAAEEDDSKKRKRRRVIDDDESGDDDGVGDVGSDFGDPDTDEEEESSNSVNGTAKPSDDLSSVPKKISSSKPDRNGSSSDNKNARHEADAAAAALVNRFLKTSSVGDNRIKKKPQGSGKTEEKEGAIPKKKVPRKARATDESGDAEKEASSLLSQLQAPPPAPTPPTKQTAGASHASRVGGFGGARPPRQTGSGRPSPVLQQRPPQAAAAAGGGGMMRGEQPWRGPGGNSPPPPAMQQLPPPHAPFVGPSGAAGPAAMGRVPASQKSAFMMQQPPQARFSASTAGFAKVPSVKEKRAVESLREVCDKCRRDDERFQLQEGPIDLSGSFLAKKEEQYDFFDKNERGEIVLQPTVPIFPEEFPVGMREHPLSWWGVLDPAIGIGKFQPAEAPPFPQQQNDQVQPDGRPIAGGVAPFHNGWGRGGFEAWEHVGQGPPGRDGGWEQGRPRGGPPPPHFRSQQGDRGPPPPPPHFRSSQSDRGPPSGGRRMPPPPPAHGRAMSGPPPQSRYHGRR